MTENRADQVSEVLAHGLLNPPAIAEEGKGRRGPGRPAKTGTFRRLDVEIEENDYSKMEEMKSWLGARTVVEVVRQALRVLYVLLKYRATGKEIQIVDPADPDKRMTLIL